MVNIFQDSTKAVPKSSPNIERVTMTEADISARKDHMPVADKSNADLVHVANSGKGSKG